MLCPFITPRYGPCRKQSLSMVQKACLLIRCLAIDVLLLRAYGSARMLLPSRCLAMGLYVTIYIYIYIYIYILFAMKLHENRRSFFSSKSSWMNHYLHMVVRITSVLAFLAVCKVESGICRVRIYQSFAWNRPFYATYMITSQVSIYVLNIQRQEENERTWPWQVMPTFSSLLYPLLHCYETFLFLMYSPECRFAFFYRAKC
jgi:hypothetical protein